LSLKKGKGPYGKNAHSGEKKGSAIEYQNVPPKGGKKTRLEGGEGNAFSSERGGTERRKEACKMLVREKGRVTCAAMVLSRRGR